MNMYLKEEQVEEGMQIAPMLGVTTKIPTEAVVAQAVVLLVLIVVPTQEGQPEILHTQKKLIYLINTQLLL